MRALPRPNASVTKGRILQPISMVRSVPKLAPRARDAHKGDLGKVLVVAGSVRMPGAAYLVGQAAMRSGAGLTTIAMPDAAWSAVAAKVVTQTLLPLPSTIDGTLALGAVRTLIKHAASFDSCAIGPGLGASATSFVVILRLIQKLRLPLVLDADALNAIASSRKEASAILVKRLEDTILTPHAGEAARLLGCEIGKIQSNRQESARVLATTFRSIIILKGANSIVTDGRRVYVNKTGNPAMATGGSGDVLAGVCASFLARGLPAFEAAQLAAYVHGQAGDLAARAIGKEGLLASDILDFLPQALARRVYRSP